MATKKYFSKGQTVICRIGRIKDSTTGKVSDKNIIGTVVELIPIDKRTVQYTVKGEDGIEYTELGVDLDYNHCIDLPKTRLYYKIMKIQDELPSPISTDDVTPVKRIVKQFDVIDEVDDADYEDEGDLYNVNDDNEVDYDV